MSSFKVCVYCKKKIGDNRKRKFCSDGCRHNFYKIQKRIHYQRNREKYILKNQKFKILNPDYHKQWRKNNKKIIRNYCLALQKKNHGYFKKYQGRYKGRYKGKYQGRYGPYKEVGQELYKKLTKKCMIKECNFKLTIDMHHMDKNRENNKKENLIGLCPNHHLMIHRLDYKPIHKNGFWFLIK